jgi:hypothetical protein
LNHANSSSPTRASAEPVVADALLPGGCAGGCGTPDMPGGASDIGMLVGGGAGLNTAGVKTAGLYE